MNYFKILVHFVRSYQIIFLDVRFIILARSKYVFKGVRIRIVILYFSPRPTDKELDWRDRGVQEQKLCNLTCIHVHVHVQRCIVFLIVLLDTRSSAAGLSTSTSTNKNSAAADEFTDGVTAATTYSYTKLRTLYIQIILKLEIRDWRMWWRGSRK